MTFRPVQRAAGTPAAQRLRRRLFALALALSSLTAGFPAGAAERQAVIPRQTIYPGETVDPARLEEVNVTNPNIVDGFVTSIDQIAGKISKRTLLPGRVIFISAVREPYAVARGTSVRLIFDSGLLKITATGTPLQDAAIGDLIRVRNIDSGVIVSGTVMQDGSVQVVAK